MILEIGPIAQATNIMSSAHICVSFILIFANTFVKSHKTVSDYLEYPGDVKLGALFPIHIRGEPCENIQKEDGIQPLEAMIFALNEINANQNILPNISLGVSAFDSCDNPIHASEDAVPLLKGFITRKLNLTCNLNGTLITRKRRHGTRRDGEHENDMLTKIPKNDKWSCGDNIVGLIGPQTTAVTLTLANFGRVFRVPQVSYLATSTRLSDTKEFPYFFRTVPSDYHQANAIVELLNNFGWNHVSIVYSDSEYGTTGFDSIRNIIEGQKDLNICLGESITIYNAHFKGIVP